MTTHSAPAQYSIRAATSDDLGQIVDLLEASSLPTSGVADALRDFLVAESDGVIIGSAGIERRDGRYALLRSTAVRDAWRGHGVGRQLVERVIASAGMQGIEALYLLTTTAEGYFPTFGFARVERDDVPNVIKVTEEFQSACPASATVMRVSLTPQTRTTG